jgi:hypothetical protein
MRQKIQNSFCRFFSQKVMKQFLAFSNKKGKVILLPSPKMSLLQASDFCLKKMTF